MAINNAVVANEVEKLVHIHKEVVYQFGENGTNLSDEDGVKLALTVYERVNKKRNQGEVYVAPQAEAKQVKQTKGNQKFKFGIPDGQVAERGMKCVKCNKPLKESASGNWYCPGWYSK